MSERDKIDGLKNLGRGFLLLVVASALSLVMTLTSQMMVGQVRPTPTIPRTLLVQVLVIGFLGFLLLILYIVSWILRIIGWGGICRGVGKKFYCYTRILLIVLPVLGVAIMIGAAMLMAMEIFTLGVPTTPIKPKGLEKWGGFFLLGAVLITVAFLVEGVALLDSSYVFASKLLRNGAFLYIAAQVFSILTGVINQLLAAPLEVATTALNVAGQILGLVSALIVYWALRGVLSVEREGEGA